VAVSNDALSLRMDELHAELNGKQSSTDGHLFRHAHNADRIGLRRQSQAGSEPTPRVLRPPDPRQVGSEPVNDGLSDGQPRDDGSDPPYWTQDDLRRWGKEQATAPPPPVEPGILDDDIARLALAVDKRLAWGTAGRVGDRDMVKLSEGKHGLKSVTKDMHNGQGIDALHGTLIVRAGQPPQMHVFQRYAGQWQRHGFTNGVADAGQLMNPSEFLSRYRSNLRHPRAEIYRLCTDAEAVAPEDFDPLDRPGGPLSGWFRYKTAKTR